MKPVGMCRMRLVEVDSPSGPAAELHDPGRRGHDRRHRVRGHQEGPGWGARVPAHQPPARLPGVRQGWRMPVAGSDRGLRPWRVRFVEEKRHYEKPIPIGTATSTALHWVITHLADDVAGDTLIHFMDRGNSTQVNTFLMSRSPRTSAIRCRSARSVRSPLAVSIRPVRGISKRRSPRRGSTRSVLVSPSSRAATKSCAWWSTPTASTGVGSPTRSASAEALNSEDRLTALMVRVDGRLRPPAGPCSRGRHRCLA